MKVLVSAIATLLIAAPTLACEGFNGQWTCDNGQKVNVSVQKTDAGYVMVDQLSKIAIVLDNKPHTGLNPLPHTYQGSCNATNLNLKINVMGAESIQRLTLNDAQTVTAALSYNGQAGTYVCRK
ncbi:MAG: hypothetical protein V4736_14115 [Bdellovibrionota bacterium]